MQVNQHGQQPYRHGQCYTASCGESDHRSLQASSLTTMHHMRTCWACSMTGRISISGYTNTSACSCLACLAWDQMLQAVACITHGDMSTRCDARDRLHGKQHSFLGLSWAFQSWGQQVHFSILHTHVLADVDGNACACACVRACVRACE